jgi:hypothetical protein
VALHIDLDLKVRSANTAVTALVCFPAFYEAASCLSRIPTPSLMPDTFYIVKIAAFMVCDESRWALGLAHGCCLCSSGHFLNPMHDAQSMSVAILACHAS